MIHVVLWDEQFIGLDSKYKKKNLFPDYEATFTAEYRSVKIIVPTDQLSNQPVNQPSNQSTNHSKKQSFHQPITNP